MPFLKLFWQICLFRLGPQDIPYSPEMFMVLVLIHVVSNTLLTWYSQTLAMAFLIALSLLMVMLVFFWALLRVFAHPERFLQTMSAFLGIDILFNIFFLLPVLNLLKMGIQAESLVLIFVLWSIAIGGHLFRHALDTALFNGIALSLCYFLLTESILNLFYGG